MSDMVDRELIRNAVFRALETVKELSFDENALPRADSDVLLGQESGLDSMGFVNFVVALEDEMARLTGQDLDVAKTLDSSDVVTRELSTVGQFVDVLHRSLQSTLTSREPSA